MLTNKFTGPISEVKNNLKRLMVEKRLYLGEIRVRRTFDERVQLIIRKKAVGLGAQPQENFAYFILTFFS